MNSIRNYNPIKTEVEGLVTITIGVARLGYSGYLKVFELISGDFGVNPFDTPGYHAEFGLKCLKYGAQQILPASGIALAIYLVGNEIL